MNHLCIPFGLRVAQNVLKSKTVSKRKTKTNTRRKKLI